MMSLKTRAVVGSLLGSMVALISITLVAGCTAPPAPLTIRMYNPQTMQTLHCTARDQTGKYSKILAESVEACARELEAKGFVRD